MMRAATMVSFLVGAMAAMTEASAVAAPVYHITDLGVVPGGYESVATAINDRGEIVGWSATPTSAGRAFVWRDGVMRDLGIDGRLSLAYAINDKGRIAGTVTLDDNTVHAFYSDGAGHAPVILDQPSLGIRATSFVAVRGINDSGRLAGWASQGQKMRGFVWDGSYQLTSEPGPENLYGINDSGVVVGMTSTWYGIDTAVVYDQGQELRPFIDNIWDGESAALAINSRGDFVGYAQTDIQRAYLYRPSEDDPLKFLSPLTARTWFPATSQANALNDARDVVGFTLDGLGKRATLWTGGDTYDLAGLLVNGQGWQLQQASGINRKGWIVGTGLLNGQTRAFLLTPGVPEPSALVSTAAGSALLALAALARRRRQKDESI